MTPHGRRRLVAGIAAVPALVAVAPCAGLYRDAGWLVHAGAAVALVTAVSLALARRPFAVALGGATAALLAFETVVVRGRAPSPGALGDTWLAMARAADALLAAPVPAAADPATTTLPAILAAATALAGAEVTHRRGSPVGALPAVGTFALALLVAGPGIRAPGTALALMTTVLALAATVSWAGDEPAAGRLRPPLALTALALAATGVVATGLVPAGGRAPADLRALRRPPPGDAAPTPTPLAEVARALADPADPVVFRVSADGPIAEGRLRIATLDDYDGDRWAATQPFAPPDAGTPGPRPGDVEQEVVLTADYRSAFVPAAHRATAVTGAGPDELLQERATGTLVRRAGAGGLRYRVRSRPRAGDHALPASDRAALTRLPAPAPLGLAAYLDQFGGPAVPVGERLAAVEADLRHRAGYDPAATPGHSYRRLLGFLGMGPVVPPAARAGTSEQPAATLAILARLAGVPARVVVGYRLPPAAASGPVDALAVRARAVHAWTEAFLPGRGWSSFDPTADGPHPPAPQAARPVDTTRTTRDLLQQSPVAAGQPGRAAPSPDPCPDTALGCVPARPAPDRRALVAALALALPPTLVVAARRARRRWRRRGGPAARVRGAWRETLDRLQRHGLVLAPSCTAADVVRHCEAAHPAAVARAAAGWIAVLDAAVYAPAEPPEHLAAQAWALEAAVARALRTHTGLGTRLRAAVDPRTLVPARGAAR